MSEQELLVVIVCAAVGYAIITFLWKLKSLPIGAKESEEKPDVDLKDASSDFEKRAWYEVLGVDSTATDEDIRKAYQMRMLEYHPDRVSHLAPEIQKLALNRTKEINVAFMNAKKRHK